MRLLQKKNQLKRFSNKHNKHIGSKVKPVTNILFRFNKSRREMAATRGRHTSRYKIAVISSREP